MRRRYRIVVFEYGVQDGHWDIQQLAAAHNTVDTREIYQGKTLLQDVHASLCVCWTRKYMPARCVFVHPSAPKSSCCALPTKVLQQPEACIFVGDIVTKLAGSENGVVAVGCHPRARSSAQVIADMAKNWSNMLLGPTGVNTLCGPNPEPVIELFLGIYKLHQQHPWPRELEDHAVLQRALQAGQARSLGFELEGCISNDVYAAMKASWVRAAAAAIACLADAKDAGPATVFSGVSSVWKGEQTGSRLPAPFQQGHQKAAGCRVLTAAQAPHPAKEALEHGKVQLTCVPQGNNQPHN